jgi:hypothetical protein
MRPIDLTERIACEEPHPGGVCAMRAVIPGVPDACVRVRACVRSARTGGPRYPSYNDQRSIFITSEVNRNARGAVRACVRVRAWHVRA